MSTEIELKLDLTPKAANKLARHPLLAGLDTQKQQLLNTYYDTAKLELHARRIAFRFRKKGWQWLSTVKTAEPASGGLALRSEWETEATPGQFEFDHVGHPELRAFLEDRRDVLEPVFTTDFRRQLWQVPFGDSVIELAVDRGSIESRGRHAKICEIELELISGRVEDIFALTRRLQDDIDLRPAIASKAERGYNLFLNEPLKPFKAKAAPISATMTPIEAFRSIALGCLEHFQRNEIGLRTSDDPEFIHQARVALRRLRSAIKLFAPILPPKFVTTYNQTWRTLACALGDARNWDVFIDETLPPIATAFPEHKDIKYLRRTARGCAKSARQSVIDLLAIREYPRLLLEFTAAIYTLGHPLPTLLTDFARQQIANDAKKARKLATRHGEFCPTELHKMRIALERLRYTFEFFAPLLPPRQVKPYLAAQARGHEELGLINDHVTAVTLVAKMLKERPTGPVQGWIAGQHVLLIRKLPTPVKIWLALPTP